MTEYFQKNLSKDILIDEYKKLLSYLNGRTRQFKAGETIYDYDEGFHEIDIINKGAASIVHYEHNGARTILGRLDPQGIFGHLLSCEDNGHAGTSVVCDSPCDILFIHYATIGSPCTKSCAHHHRLTQNLLDPITERALSLNRRVEILSQYAIREKLICYFMQLTTRAKTSPFSLPFTMMNSADYLSIDHNAIARKLKRMKGEGLTGMDKRCVHLFF